MSHDPDPWHPPSRPDPAAGTLGGHGQRVDSPPIRDDQFTITLRVTADRQVWQVRVADGHRVQCLAVEHHDTEAVLVERILDAVRHGKLELAGIRHLVAADDPWADPVPSAVDSIRAFVTPVIATAE
ncbi:hypothetical protein [Micromonospora coxensis]|uniref:Uncharacterized protein n=1 Tax=Micromonospora coxensis TaxID=356852 RepID=A0A1C5JHY8_9ACTN|nr:hypothetical protein [Micromonospora coxensis]SCG70187.1 hypothetical protein GA0070614_4652 [Micromonospora coxensis]